MELGIDARCLRTGIGTYVSNLLMSIAQRENEFTIRAIANRRDSKFVKHLCHSVAFVDAPMYSVREQWEVARAARGCDLLHVPHYNAPLMFPGKLLVSIHDLVHIMDPTFNQRFSSWVYARPMLHLVARKAVHVVTVSQYSKTQIIGRLGISPGKVTVVYCGVDGRFNPSDPESAVTAVRVSHNINVPYILFVGSLKPHKNVSRLLRAFAQLRASKRIRHSLVIVGDDALGRDNLAAETARLGLDKDVLFIRQVSDVLLPDFYRAADLLVMPSTLEGFGLPVVEAMACGTPVACSNAASLPEVAGDAAEFFDPVITEDMAAAIERVASCSSRRHELRKKGLEQASKFSWQRCAEEHTQLYYSLFRSPSAEYDHTN